MKLFKQNVIRICKHHFAGFNTHKEFLCKAINTAGDQLSVHDVDSIKISLNNMKEQIHEIETYISCNQPSSSKPVIQPTTHLKSVYLMNKENFYFHIKVSNFSLDATTRCKQHQCLGTLYRSVVIEQGIQLDEVEGNEILIEERDGVLFEIYMAGGEHSTGQGSPLALEVDQSLEDYISNFIM